MFGSPIAQERSAGAAVLALALVAAGCGGAPGTPSPSQRPPIASPTASAGTEPSPTAAPADVAWAWQAPLGPMIAVGRNGAVYATGRSASCAVEVHALATTGAERQDGWPFCVPGAPYADFLVTDDAGTVYVGGASPGGIVGLAPDGTVGAGWPAPFGWLVGTLGEGVVVMEPSPAGPSELHAYTPDGRELAGWSVTVPGPIAEPAVVGPGDAVAVLYLDPATGHRFVTTIERSGATRAGWPVAVPNEMDGRSVVIDLVTRDGRVVLRSHEPWPLGSSIEAMAGLRAQVAVIGPDGTVPPAWPVRLEQPLSPLVEAPDGRLVGVAGDVQYGPGSDIRAPTGPYAVVSLEPDGSATPGWPAALADGVVPLPAAVSPGPVPPWALPPVVAADGSVVVVARWDDGAEGLAWLDRDGSPAIAYRLPDRTIVSSGVPAAPGGPAILPVMIGSRAFLAIGLAGPEARSDRGGSPVDAAAGSGPIPAVLADTRGGLQDAILAVERTGAVAGWPVPLPNRGYVGRMLAAPDGTLLVAGMSESEAVVLSAIGATVTGAGT